MRLLLSIALAAAAPVLQATDADFTPPPAVAPLDTSTEPQEQGVLTAFLIIGVVIGLGVAFFVGYYVGSVTTTRRVAQPSRMAAATEAPPLPPMPALVSAMAFAGSVHRQTSAIAVQRQVDAVPPPPAAVDNSLLDSYRIKRN